MSPGAEQFLIKDIETTALNNPQETEKPEYFREPKNFFGINVTVVNPVVGPHWHPNADEFDYFLNGHGVVGIIAPKNKDVSGDTGLYEFEVKAGDVIVIPQGYAHFYVNKSGPEDPLTFLAVFNNPGFKLIDTSQVPEPA